ncbi:hypothetical protein [Streptomyces sp. NPDC091027]|uniref:hypothetical protein n=1 Tax=Streptomyces sp. NPDC091027 TaxID=3365971 RepID=UPI003814D2B7
MTEETGVWELWDGTYRALLPWTLVPPDDLNGRCRESVTAALAVSWGGCDDDVLDAPGTGEQIHAVLAARTAYGLGWRDAVLGDVAARARSAGLGDGPAGLWAPAGRGGRGRGRPLRPTLRGDLEFFAVHPWGSELEVLRAVRCAVEAHADDPRAALGALLRTAWQRHATERRGWDDAEWWQYLDVAALASWAVVALALPAPDPARAGADVEEAAEAAGPRDWTRAGTGLPDGFLDAAFDALGI